MSFFSKNKEPETQASFVGHDMNRIFLVLLPHDVPKKDNEQDIRQPSIDRIRELIGSAERIMAAVGGMKSGSGIMAKVAGNIHQQVSFEIVAHKGVISFYVVVPEHLVNYMLQHIRASYSDIELEEVEDYNLFSVHGVVIGASVKQSRTPYLPIKTYQYFESDPFESLTNTLSKIGDDESIAVQFIVRSAPSSWHQEGKKAVIKIQKGESIYQQDTGAVDKIMSGIGRLAKDTLNSSSSDQTKQPEDQKPVRLSPKEEEMAKIIEDKNAKAGLEVNMRILVTGNDTEILKLHLQNIINGLTQYNIYEYGNSLTGVMERSDKIVQDFIYRKFSKTKKMILNTEELISLYHFPLPTTSTPNIRWLTSRKAATPVNLPANGVSLGVNEYRNTETEVRISDKDRGRHIYIIGTTGVGKSNLMYHIALQDIQLGRGVGVIDPHGDFVEHLLENIPSERYEDVVVFGPANMDYPVALNMLEAETVHEKDFVTQEMIQIFYKLVTDPSMIGPMFEHYMRNAMLTLMADEENPGTILEIPRIFTDEDYRKSLMPKVKDPVVRAFWEKEMAQTSTQSKSDMLGYLISKVGRFIENEMMRNIIGQPHSTINFKEIIEKKKILLVNLSKGRIGEINSMLLGLIVVSKLQMAAFSQAEKPEHERRSFYLFIDEFQNFVTDSISVILSEARKYKLALTMAHQYLGQLVKANDTTIRDAVLGNVGTMVSFRIGVEDAPTVAAQMAPVFNEYDLVNMERFNCAVKMLVNNTVERAFSMKTYPPLVGDPKRAELIRELSSRKYGRPRVQVEKEILERSKLGSAVSKASEGEVEATL